MTLGSPTRERRVIRTFLYLGGGVATTAGLHTAAAGGRSFPPWRTAGAELESELRFFAVYYAAYGWALLRIAPRADLDTRRVAAHVAPLFCAGVARAGAWLRIGKPHPLQRLLLVLEMGLPPILVALQQRAEVVASPETTIGA